MMLGSSQLKIQVKELMLESNLRHIGETSSIILDQGYDKKTDKSYNSSI